jgi:hypothetical protein
MIRGQITSRLREVELVGQTSIGKEPAVSDQTDDRCPEDDRGPNRAMGPARGVRYNSIVELFDSGIWRA